MKAKEELLKLIENKTWSNLPNFIKSHGRGRSKANTDLEEALGEMSHSQQDLVWGHLVSLFMENYIGKYFGMIDILELVEDQMVTENEEEDLEIFESLLVLGTIQIHVLIDEKRQNLAPSENMVQFIVLIGGLLSEFSDLIQEAAVELCETWILNNLEKSEQILADTLLTIVTMCLREKAKVTEVKRAWQLHQGLSDLSVRMSQESGSNKPIQDLLVLAATSPLFLRCEEGLKFLSLLLSIPCLVKPFHAAVKGVLPTVTTAQSEKYAQVYFRAWKKSQGPLRKTLEQDCLQDLMHLAVHADPLLSRLPLNLLAFLRHLHRHKKHLQTASVIYSLYEPFIWRSLKVANGYVRANAAVLLCDLFPCTDVSLSHEERDELMERQYEALLALLVDPCHLVRIATIKGVFSILGTMWPMVPGHVIQKMFQVFIGKLLVDASSAEIRRLVVQGLTLLLDCPLASPFLSSSVLPRVAAVSFDDVSAPVRIQFMKLLLKVKATRFIKYWTLVPMEHLLNRLARDVSGVRSLITQLILSSFLSAHFDDQELLHRCVSLLELNREGARRFYQHAAKNLDVEASTRFVLLIWRTFHRYINQHNSSSNSSLSISSSSPSSPPPPPSSSNGEGGASARGKGKGKKKDGDGSAGGGGKAAKGKNRKRALVRQSQNKENTDVSDAPPAEMPLDNPAVSGGLLDVVVIVWTVKLTHLCLPQNNKFLEAIRTRTARVFPLVWSFFKENDDISNTLLYVASLLPKSHVPTMVGHCLSRLKAFEDTQDELDCRFGTYINALCNWNRFDDVLELVSDWVEAAFVSAADADVNVSPSVSSSQSGTKSSSRKKRVGRVRFDVGCLPKPNVALRILRHVLQDPLNKLALLQTNRILVVSICRKFSAVQPLLEKRFHRKQEGPLSSLCSDHFLSMCWIDYLCIVSLLNLEKEEEKRDKEGEEEEEEEEGEGGRGRGRGARRRSSLRSNSSSPNLSTASIGEGRGGFDSLARHKEHLAWMDRLLADNADNLSFDWSFYFVAASACLKASADVVAIGVADAEFMQRYLDFQMTVSRKAPFDLKMWLSSLRGLSQVHSHYSAYGPGNDHLLPGSSVAFKAFSQLMTCLGDKEAGLDLLQKNEFESMGDAISSSLVSLSKNSNLILEAASERLVKITLASLEEQLEGAGADTSLPELTRVAELPRAASGLVSAVQKKTRLAEAFAAALGAAFECGTESRESMWSGVLLLSLLWQDGGRISRHSLKLATQKARDAMLKEGEQDQEQDLDNSRARQMNGLLTDMLENL